VILDPKPTCGVTTSGPILQGQNVTLSCSTKNYHKLTSVPPAAKVKASQEWESAAGTLLSSTSTPVTDNSIPVGETLQTDVWTIATGTEFPSYNCTSMFDFHDFGRSDVATNYVSWTCVTEPVLVWCTYLLVIFVSFILGSDALFEFSLSKAFQ